MTGTTAAARVLAQRRKDRRLPTMEGVQVQDPELARAIQNVQEHFRMYEGDSGAPKERFVTIAELENAGLIKSDTKSGFAYISQVLEKDVAQKAGSTANPTLKDPVKRDTSRQSRTPGGGGGGGGAKAQASTATTQKLNDSQDVNVAKPAKNEFLYYDGNKFTNFPLFNRQNVWRKQQHFVQPLKMQEVPTGPAALEGFGYLWVKEGAPNTLWFTDDGGTETQLSSSGGTLPAGTTTNTALKWNGASWVEDTDVLFAGSYARFNEEIWGNQAISVQGPVSDVGQVGQFGFIDINGGEARFGSYDYDAGAWQPVVFRGSTVEISSQTGTIELNTASNQDILFQNAGATQIRMDTSAQVFMLEAGTDLRIWDSGNTDYATFSHDGANFNLIGVNSSNFEISGFNNVDINTADLVFGATGGIDVYDSRAVDDAPNAYDSQVRFDFKQRSVYGFQGNDTYGGVMTIAPWTDTSGGPNYQLAFSNNSNVPLLAIRAGDHGATAGDWGTWYQVHSTVDFPTPPGGSTDFLRADGTWAAPSGGLANIVEDTTPQLGGNLDLNGFNITSTVNVNNGIEAGYLGVNSTSGSDGHGLSLYNGYSDGEPTYGMFFGQTATFGTHGEVTGDWATYFTMSNTSNRGWIWRTAGTANVASLDTSGNMQITNLKIDSTNQVEIIAGAEASFDVNGATALNIRGMDENDTGMNLEDGMSLVFEDRAQANQIEIYNDGVGGNDASLVFDSVGVFGDLDFQIQLNMNNTLRMGSGFDINWSNATQPWLTLDSISSGDSWSSQGAGISVGESGKQGSAAIHMTYNGDGSGYIGMGTVDNTATTGGRPTYGHIDFTYNSRNILVGGLLYPGNSAGTTGSSLVQAVAYIESADSQNYGSINVAGAAGSSGTYAGYSINRRVVFMNNNSTTSGIYNDTNNEWMQIWVENGASTIYYNGVQSLRTSAIGTGGTSAAQVLDHGSAWYDVGFNILPSFNVNVSDTLEANHCGHMTGKTNTSSYTLTGPTSSDLDFPVGGVCTIMNLGTSTNYTINDTSTCTMYVLTGAAVTDIVGSATVAPGGIVTLYRYSSSAIYLWGSGLTP